jgi:hypothetical protein
MVLNLLQIGLADLKYGGLVVIVVYRCRRRSRIWSIEEEEEEEDRTGPCGGVGWEGKNVGI